MPRTFSRGKKFSAADLIDLYQSYLTVAEKTAFEDLVTLLICPAPLEQPLKEQEIIAPIITIRENLRKLQLHFDDFHGDVLPSTDREERFDVIIAELDALIALVENSFLLV